MISGQPVSLQQSLERAAELNERKLAAEIAIPPQNLDKHSNWLKFFSSWASQKGVRACPARPAVIVAWIRHEEAVGTQPALILKSVEAIRALHDKHALPSPIDTAVVRPEIWRLLIKAGHVHDELRWSREEMILFDALADDVKEVIVRRSAFALKEVRRKHHEVTDLWHRVKQLETELAQLRATLQPKEGTEGNGL